MVVRGQQYWGTADKVKFSEEQDRIIFEGTDGRKANLYRVRVPGLPFDKVTGRKIIFWRKTNNYKVDDGEGINITQ